VAPPSQCTALSPPSTKLWRWSMVVNNLTTRHPPHTSAERNLTSTTPSRPCPPSGSVSPVRWSPSVNAEREPHGQTSQTSLNGQWRNHAFALCFSSLWDCSAAFKNLIFKRSWKKFSHPNHTIQKWRICQWSMMITRIKINMIKMIWKELKEETSNHTLF